MDTVYVVETRDMTSEWRFTESVHSTAAAAEAARKDRQMIWGEGTTLNPARYYVSVRPMALND